MEDFIKLIKRSSKRHPGYLGKFSPLRLWNYRKLKKGLDKEVKAGMVNVQSHPQFPHLKIYKYSQDAVCEKHWNEITIIARGLILDIAAKKVVATPFLKFWNYSELIPISEIMEKDFIALEKMDGCCDEDTELETEDGVMTIKKICDSKYSKKVLSYNIYDDKIEFKEILGHSILNESDDWYELETEENVTIKLTGNHKVFLPELNCYRRVDELNGNEKLLLKR